MESLLRCIARQQFRVKEIQQWNRLYAEFRCEMCPKRKREFIVDIRTNGSKYFACANYSGAHHCAVVPIAIGSTLDIEIQTSIIGADEARMKIYAEVLEFFFGTLLNFGFYAYFPKYMINNNKQLHRYAHANAAPISRVFFYDENNYGHMIYANENGDMVVRLPTTEEYILDEAGETMRHSISNEVVSGERLARVLEYNCPREAVIDFAALRDMFALTDRLAQIDDISNKLVLSAPILIEGLLQTMFTTDDARKIKSIKQAITAGNLFVQICKREANNNTRKSQKEVSRFIGKNKTKSQYIERQMYVNTDETAGDCAFNQIKRPNNKHSKFIAYDVPTNALCIVTPFYCANMTKASKNLLLANSAAITFVDARRIDDIFALLGTFSQRGGDFVVVVNSIPTTLRLSVESVLPVYVALKVIFRQVKVNIVDRFFFVVWQSGLLQFPIQVRAHDGSDECCCGNFIARNADGDISTDNIHTCIPPHIEKFMRNISTAGRCTHHFMVDNDEIKMLERIFNYRHTFYYYQIMDHDSIDVVRYARHTPLFKLITAVKTARNRYTTKSMKKIAGNKELTKGVCEEKTLRLFTVFYDFLGGTVGDGYIINARLKLPFHLSVKHTMAIVSKERVKIQPIKRLVLQPHAHIRVCRLYSNNALQFKCKRMSISQYARSRNMHVYIVTLPIKSNLAKKIDPSTIRIGVQAIKQRTNLSLTFDTYRSPTSNIKMSNSFGQKGMCKIASLDALTTESGRAVDVVSNPTSIMKRQAFGQIKDMREVERVFHNGVYIGMGGVCDYFLVETHPHDEIYCGVYGSPMKFDQLTYIASIGTNNPRIDSELERPFNELPTAHVQKILELSKIFGKRIDCSNHHNFIY